MLKETDVTAAFRLFASLGLAGGPTSQAATVAMVEAWVDVLGDMDPADFAAATRQAARKSAFWPKPADVLGFSAGVAHAKLQEVERRIDWWPIVLPTRSTAGRGATDGRLLHCFKSYAGSRLGIEADEEDFRRVSLAVEAIGGWDALGSMSEQEALYARGRFLKALEARQEPDNVVRLADEASRRKQLRGGPQRLGGG